MWRKNEYKRNCTEVVTYCKSIGKKTDICYVDLNGEKNNMWKMERKFLIFLLCVAMCSCSTRQAEVVTIDIDKAIQSGNEEIGNFMEIDRLIPIKDKDILLGTCDKVLATDSLCYIMDSKRILVLGFDGHIRSEIDKRGSGPEEYLEITDFDVDDEGNIIVYDSDNRKVFFYTSQGRFLKHTDATDGTSFCLLEDGGMAFYRNIFSDTVVAAYDRNMCYRQGYVTGQSRPNIVLGNGGKIVEHAGSLYFTNPLDYNIYKCDGESCASLLRFDFGSRNLPEDVHKEKDLRKLLKLVQANENIIYLDNLYVNDRMICLYDSDSRLIIHDLTNAETLVFSQLKKPHNFLLENPVYAHNGHFAGFVQANVIQNIFLPMSDAEVHQYPFLEILKSDDAEDWLENDWIVVGHYVES